MMNKVLAILLLLSTLGCATIHRHPKLTAFVVTSVAVSTVVAVKMRDPHCNHYEPGNNGVNMPCPVESK